ncbi:hypothetical protein DPMN_191023 [Dreissena polymorpha]|uniref:Uncharacterized protein n=1 Tax=Dreissena polymorpha TaxID=45954 RepID=A0A9D4B796_DREPO|nr:hypothetical protein DPMN_191023 [Dreissena polymorpha]
MSEVNELRKSVEMAMSDNEQLTIIALAFQVVPSIFQWFADTGKLPKDWGDVNISQVFKKGDRHSHEKYRPVSLGFMLSRLLIIIEDIEPTQMAPEWELLFNAKKWYLIST